ncbi:hypothetical protein SAMN04487783_0990 [Agrococcus baldri]|uniref:Uncharacterized protein n=1 Tax=Agrococcus baldri TaxID=153730 RepID=A0AA94HLG1_9MICO|nr:hypothetical protein [Agrococcus baldri]SFS07667.1 hypothetical protein SAMN04487783_0990 [Agrococcus baldri]
MGWLEPAAWALVLGTTAALILLGPRIWHSRSWQRARRSGGPGILDEIYRPAAYEQQLAAQSQAEAGDSIDQLEPRRPARNPNVSGVDSPH